MSNNLSATNCKGRQVNLLNDDKEDKKKRKHHCTKCQKSFTTSGHLARHFRIHTGEKNFYCLYPGCPSRFSRQDNMMQHYKTHISAKSRRNRYYHFCQAQEYEYYNYDLPSLQTQLPPISLSPTPHDSYFFHPNYNAKSETITYYTSVPTSNHINKLQRN